VCVLMGSHGNGVSVAHHVSSAAGVGDLLRRDASQDLCRGRRLWTASMLWELSASSRHPFVMWFV